jgi:Uma2 family endonuclease
MATMSAGSSNRYRITADEYFRMGEAGVLRPDARVELIEGEIIEMPPIGSPHAAIVDQLGDLLHEALAHRAIVRRQHPVVLDEYSVPQPDLAVVIRRDDYYRRAHPQPNDLLLLVEVADSTLAFDRKVKAGLYARTGAPEFWLVDVAHSRVTRFLSPRDGVYAEALAAGARDTIAMAAFADIRIDLSVIFPD